MFDRFLKSVPWLSILLGCGTAIYAAYALVIGEVIVESRHAGRSIVELSQQPGAFYGFVAFYFVCAAVFIALGVLWQPKK